MNKFVKILMLIVITQLVSGCSNARSNGRAIVKAKSVRAQELQQIIKPITHKQFVTSAVKKLPVKRPANSYLLSMDESLEVSISKFGYTRFSIEDERITDVFVYPQEALQVRIHNQGYLVVVPNQAMFDLDISTPQKIYLTVTGEDGTTQDLSLRFTGRSPKPVKFVKTNLGINLTSKEKN